MRKIFSLVLAILLMASFVTIGFAGKGDSPGIGEIKGQGKFDSDPHRTFRLVRWMPNASFSVWPQRLSAESIVIWDTSASGDDGVTITTTSTSGDSRVAGIVVVSAEADVSAESTPRTPYNDIGHTNWTWLQTYGLADVRMGLSGKGTVGEALATGPNHGGASRFTLSADIGTTTDDVSDSTQYGNAGFFMNTAGVNTTGETVFVRCE